MRARSASEHLLPFPSARFANLLPHSLLLADRLAGRSVMMVHLASFYGRQGKLGPSVYDLAKVAREADQSMEPLKEVRVLCFFVAISH